MFYTLYAIVYTHFEHFKTVLFFDIVQVKLATVLLNLSLLSNTAVSLVSIPCSRGTFSGLHLEQLVHVGNVVDAV